MPIKGEWVHQKALVGWFKLQYPALSRLLIYVPNGSHNWGARKGKTLKDMGLQADVPDLWLLTPRHHYHALAIELKSVKGASTKKQREYHELLRAQGYKVEVARGFDEGRSLIIAYLTV